MTPAQIAALVGCAVLVFWAVGAYNRLTGLRDDIAKAFVAVDAQVQHRHALLLQWAGAIHAAVGQAPALYEAALAACAQLQSACEGLRERPSAHSAATHWRLAEHDLAVARQHLQAEWPAPQQHGLEITALADQLSVADSTLAYAGGQFNAATQAYNEAIRQFPTRLVAAAFGFQAAGTL